MITRRASRWPTSQRGKPRPGGNASCLTPERTPLTRPRSKAIGVIAAIAAVVVIVALIYFKRHHRPDLVLSDGTVVKDLSASEAGLVAADRFAGVRGRYLAVKPFYDELDFVSLPDGPDEAMRLVEAAVERELVDSQSSRAVLNELPTDAKEGLLRHVTLALRVLGGLPREEYERLRAELEDDLVPAVPLNLVRSYAPELGDEGSAPSAEAIERTFARFYDEYAQPGAPHHVIRLADAEAGWVVAVFEQPSSQAISKVAEDQWASPEERSRFLGGLTAAAFMFHRPSHSIGDMREHPSLVRAVTAVVIEARDGTRFPVWIDCYFDPVRQNWRTNIIFRMMAPMVVNSPTPAF